MNRAIAGQFVESAGFGGSEGVRFARYPAQASLFDGMGNPVQPLTLAGDAIPLDFSAGETLRLKAEWV
jgi:hypothetical protein